MAGTRDLREKTRRFAVRIVRLCRSLPRTMETKIIASQLLRCGTSVGANYRAVCRARSRPEFAAKLALSRKRRMKLHSGWNCLLTQG